MADSIGTLSAKLTADSRGVTAGCERAKRELQGLANTKVPQINIGASIMEGMGIGAGFGVGSMITSAVGNALQSIKGFHAEAWKITDDAGDLGLTTTQYQQLAASAQLAGESMDTVSNAMTKMERAIADAYMGGEGAADNLKQLGLSAEELIGLSADEQLSKIAVAISKIENAALRTRMEMELFGKSGKKMNDILADIAAGGTDKYASLAVSSRAMNAMTESYGDFQLGLKQISTWTKEIYGGLLANLGFGKQAADEAEREKQARKASVEAEKLKTKEMQRQAAEKKAMEAADNAMRNMSDERRRMNGVSSERIQLDKTIDDLIAAAGGTRDDFFRNGNLVAVGTFRAESPLYEGGDPHAADKEKALQKIYWLEQEYQKTKQLKAQTEEQRKLDSERNRLASDMQSALDSMLTPAEKLAKEQERINHALDLGAVSREDAFRLREKATADFERAGQKDRKQIAGIDAAQGGTQDEVSARARYVNEATAAQDKQAALQQQQLDQAKQQTDLLADIRTNTKPAPVWSGN